MSLIDDKIRESRERFGDGIEPGCVCVTCEISRFRDALEVAADWMKVQIEEMDCRGDEDCDHCEGIQSLDQIERILDGKAGG